MQYPFFVLFFCAFACCVTNRSDRQKMTENLALDDDEKGQPLNPKNFLEKSATDTSMSTVATVKYAGKKLVK